MTRLQRDLLDQAAEAATYWLGLCVFEQGEFELAADWLQRYLDRYGRQGRWSPSAQALLDQALAHGSSPAPGP
jgi:TolA-binding protein